MKVPIDTGSMWKPEVHKVLLADLTHLRSELVRNENIGETRFQFFIGWITAVTGALVALAQVQKSEGSDGFAFIDEPEAFYTWVTGTALGGLLAIGLLTYFRLIHRNKVTDHIRKMCDDVERRMLTRCGGLAPTDYDLVWPQNDGLSGVIRAGYAEVVGLISGALLGALVLGPFGFSLSCSAAFALVLGLLLWIFAIGGRRQKLGETTMGKHTFIETSNASTE